MATITQTQGSPSSAIVDGQSTEYITDQVLQQMPGCPDTLAQSTLQNVIREFYYKSTAWREVIGPYSILQGVNTISLNPVDQFAQCHLVLDVFVYPDTAGGLTPRYLQPAPRRMYGPDVGPPLQYWMDGPDTLVMYPVPDITYGNLLYSYMSLMPVLNTDVLPNIAFTHHFDGLLFGTLHRLGMMQNKPWSVKDPTMLNLWSRTFRQNILLARDIAQRGWSKSDAQVWFPNFAGRGSQNPATASGWSSQ